MYDNDRCLSIDYLNRSRDQKIKSLREQVFMESMPYGKYTTSSDKEYYFNKYYEIIFGCDTKRGNIIPTSRDMYVDDIIDSETEFYHDWKLPLPRKVGKLAKSFDVYYTFMKEYNKYFNTSVLKNLNWDINDMSGFKLPFVGYKPPTKRDLIDLVVISFLPYGVSYTAEGHEFYHGRGYDYIFAFNPLSNVLVPNSCKMIKLEERHDYVYNDFGGILTTPDKTFRESLGVMDKIFHLCAVENE